MIFEPHCCEKWCNYLFSVLLRDVIVYVNIKEVLLPTLIIPNVRMNNVPVCGHSDFDL